MPSDASRGAASSVGSPRLNQSRLGAITRTPGGGLAASAPPTGPEPPVTSQTWRLRSANAQSQSFSAITAGLDGLPPVAVVKIPAYGCLHAASEAFLGFPA